jgi:hypothetical protein
MDMANPPEREEMGHHHYRADVVREQLKPKEG